MSNDPASAGEGDRRPPAGNPSPRPQLPLAPKLFLLGLGTLLLSWLGFMSYYVFVKARQPQPVPEWRLPVKSATNQAGLTNRGSPRRER